MRCGEAAKLKWVDVDFERRTVSVRAEKGSDPRILPISDKSRRNAKERAKGIRASITCNIECYIIKLLFTAEGHCKKTWKPKVAWYTLPSPPALERDNGKSQDKRPLSCKASSWPPAHGFHNVIHQCRASHLPKCVHGRVSRQSCTGS